MEESKVAGLIKAEDPMENKNVCMALPTLVKEVLTDDINYCKERILESQKKLENIQTLLKLTRYSTIKDFYENKKTILDTTDNQLLKCTLSHQHPSVLAAQEQLLKLQSRPKRQAAKKVLINTKKEKIDKIRLKSKHADLHTEAKLLDINISSPNIKDEIEKNITKDESANNNLMEKKAVSGQVLPVLNANRSSRFYSRYTLLIGNTSQFLGDDNYDKCTHSWCIYVRRPEDQPNASEIIRKVTFHLDASYKPNDVIEVVSEPFSLSKRGWGEFPIKIEMFFKSNDKPVSFIHNLKLDKLKTGRYCLDTETAVEVVLDINPNLKETSLKETCDNDLSRKKLNNGENFEDEVALTNIKNILKYNNVSSDNESVKLIVDRDIQIKSEVLECQFDNYIYLKEPLLIHCISNSCDNEYLINVPQKHSSLNLKYLETPEKLMFLNSAMSDMSTESKPDIKTLCIKKSDNIVKFEPNQNLKRKCPSELFSITANKVKIVDSSNVNGIVSPKAKGSILKPLKLNENLTEPASNKLEINAGQQSLLMHNIKANTSAVKRNPAIHFSKQSSLLKCNNLTNKSNIKTQSIDVKQSQNSHSSKKSLLFNNSILSSNFTKTSNSASKSVEDNPKIIIVRRGNSVLTTQNTFITQPKRIQWSPERKLLGPKKNTDDKRISEFGYNANSCSNNIVYSTFDSDVDNLKNILGQLDVCQVVEYALKRVPLYAKPEHTQGIFFEVPTQQEFANYSLIKQVALEIKRSKCIYDFLKSLYPIIPEHWDYVRIFRYAREYGYLPREHKYWSKILNDEHEKSLICNQDATENATKEKKKITYRSYSNTDNLLGYFDKLLVSIPKDVHDTVEDVDIESVSDAIKHTERTTAWKNLMLPILYGDKETCQYIINSAKAVGVTFLPEQLAIGVDHPSALEVTCSVLKSFLSEVVRKSLGVCRLQGGSSIEPEHVFSSILSRTEFDMLSNKYLGS